MPRMARRIGRVAVLALVSSGLLASPGCEVFKKRRAMNEGVGSYKAKRYDDAAESFKRAIRIDQDYAEAYKNLGLTYMQMYEPGSEHPKDIEYADGAIQAFKRYIELDPGNQKGKEYLINICSVSHRMQDAIDFFLKDFDRNPSDLQLVKLIAALYHRAGDTENAIQWFEKAAQLEPTNPEAWYSVGVACWGRSYNSMYLEYEDRMALIDNGLEALDRARQLKKDYYEAITYESLLYREKVKYDISPAATVQWRQKADELLARAMELRNAAMAAQAAAAAAQQGGAAPAGGTTPASTPGGGE